MIDNQKIFLIRGSFIKEYASFDTVLVKAANEFEAREVLYKHYQVIHIMYVAPMLYAPIPIG